MDTPIVARTRGPPSRSARRTAVPRNPASCNEILVICLASCSDLAEPTSDVVATVEPFKLVKNI